MKREKRNDKPVVLRLPSETFERVDIAAHEQNVTRTQFLRQSVERNLNHYETHEQPVYRRLHFEGLR